MIHVSVEKYFYLIYFVEKINGEARINTPFSCIMFNGLFC